MADVSEKVLAKLKDEVRALLRRAAALEPKALRKGEALAPTATKLGGTPYAEAGDAWPTCGSCQQGLTFIFQGNLADLPQDASRGRARRGLFSFFYCRPCRTWGDDEEAEAGAWALRRYADPRDEKAVTLTDTSPAKAQLRPCRVDLSAVPSLPDWDGLGEVYAPALEKRLRRVERDEPEELYARLVEEELGAELEVRTQLGGYPKFIQSADVPECPTCDAAMGLLAQVDSEEAARLMWEDTGSVMLFACDKHPSRTALRLQSC